MYKILFFIFVLLLNCKPESTAILPSVIKTGADRTEFYLPLVEGKGVGLVANHTSMVGKTHLADTLISLGVNVIKIFAPEHGFRGSAGAGDIIKDTIDSVTGKPVISLYGSSVKPKAEDLKGIEIMIYDIQDVGVRFYTYISTMHYIMEACAEQGISLLIFDRPNPLGHYVDGPVLDTSVYRSFVGMHPVPVVYGMTAGELAGMINNEGWLKGGIKCELQVVPCGNYDHNTFYSLPVNPSPNLRSMEAIYLYPSVCFFEGTIMSLGRGTDHPFTVVGHPDYPDKAFSFIPRVNEANSNPLFLNLVEGSIFKVSDSARTNEVLISKYFSDLLNLKTGDRFAMYFIDNEPRGRSFTVAGIYQTSLMEFDRQFILADIGHLQNLNGWDSSQVSGFEILINDYKSLDFISSEVFNIAGVRFFPDGTKLRVINVRERYPQIFDWLGLIDKNVWVLLGLMLIVSVFNMISGLLIIILDRTTMIGILKALGMNNHHIRTIFLYQSLYIMIKGFFWGNLVGLGICLLQYYFKFLTLNPESYFLEFVPINFNLTYLILLNVGTLLLTLVVLMLPSMIIARIDPSRTIRFD